MQTLTVTFTDLAGNIANITLKRGSYANDYI